MSLFSVSAGYDKFKVNLNIEHNIRRGLRGVAYDSVKGGRIAVCGNGPSLKTIELPKDIEYVALNGALQALIDRGITPKYAICYDPTEKNAEFFRRAPKKTKYLIASRCDSSVFEALKGRDVRIFHIVDEPEMAAMQRGLINSIGITGGSTVGLKSLRLLNEIGYDQFELYGYDSCLMNGEHHATSQPWNDGQGVHQVAVGDKEFLATVWMGAQAEEALQQFEVDRLHYSVNIHGDGLLAALWDAATLKVNYDLGRAPPTYDFLSYMMNVENDRKINGYKHLKINFVRGDVNGFRNEVAPLRQDDKEQMLDRVCRPMVRMFGATEGGNGENDRGLPYILRPTTEAAKRGYELPDFAPSKIAQCWAEKLVGNEPTHVITLRESYYWTERNSNLEAWLQFAKTIKERVIFVRDTEKADEPLHGFETCPEASRDIQKRLALYGRAKMNYFIANGPAMLCQMTKDIPYICFMPNVTSYVCLTSEFLYRNCGIVRGGRWPWQGQNQKLVWDWDTYDNIVAAHENRSLYEQRA